VEDPLALLFVGNQEDPIVGYNYVGIDAYYGLGFLLEPGDLFSLVERARVGVGCCYARLELRINIRTGPESR